MSHYRAPPAVLPSLRKLDAPFPLRGDRAHWNEDVDEQVVRLRARGAPCPAFAVDPAAAFPPMHKVFRYVPPPALSRLIRLGMTRERFRSLDGSRGTKDKWPARPKE